MNKENKLILYKDEASDKTKDKDIIIERGKGQEIPKSEQIAAQLEAQQFLMHEMPEWHYPPHYGEYNKEEEAPYYFSTVEMYDSLGESLIIVLKSYKKQDEPFKINPIEWESIIEDSAYLLIYTGNDIKRITQSISGILQAQRTQRDQFRQSDTRERSYRIVYHCGHASPRPLSVGRKASCGQQTDRRTEVRTYR